MFNFNWFNKPKYTEQTTATDDMLFGDTPEYPTIPPVAPPPPTKPPVEKALYTIGNISDGSVVLMMHNKNFGTTTLTMNRAATEHMIRLLQAALVPQPEENENAESI